MFFYYCIIIIHTLKGYLTNNKGINMTNKNNNNPAYNWDLYLKQCMEVAATSITPYKIIPYKKYNGIKQVVIEKQFKQVA